MLSHSEISHFCMKLYLLVHAGMGIGDALSLAADDIEEPWILKMSSQVDSGELLSVAMTASGVFPVYVCGLVEMGEQAGRLEEVLSTLSDYYEKRAKFDRYLQDTLMYPVMMLMLMVLVIGVILVKVLPVFDEVYASLGTRLSGVSAVFLLAGQWISRSMPLLFAVIGLVSLGILVFNKSEYFRKRVLSFWRSRYGDRGIARRLNNVRIVQAVALGMDSGMSMADAVALASAVVSDIPGASERCRICRGMLDRGDDQSEALSESGILDKSSCKLLEFGQRSGSEDVSIGRIARDLSSDSEEELNALAGRIEPGITMVCSLLVGVILLSVMLPLMNIMSAIG